MTKVLSILKRRMWLIAVAAALPTGKTVAEERNVLVLSSYNPDANGMSIAINAMEKTIKERGENVTITVESLGYDYLSDLSTWKSKMTNLLNKYRQPDLRPDIIVTLGQEAMSSYLSQDASKVPDIPVVCGMCSRNYIEMPKDGRTAMTTWSPATHDITEVATLYNVVGGHFYSYDVEKNVSLIRSLFPYVTDIAFLSDNSYGGICMKSLMMEYASQNAEVNFKWLDGRDLTLQTATDTITHLDDKTALLIGTWRFDKDSRFLVTSSLSMIKQNNKRRPILTLSSVGLNDCAIGGYMPDYQNIGILLAKSISEYFNKGTTQMNYIPSHYVFNASLLEEMGIGEDKLPKYSTLINERISILRRYASQVAIIALIILILSASLAVSVHNLRKIKRLKSELEKKQKELIAAKNRAEANSSLKTSFLANMSHEIRTPLNAVVGFSQVIATQYDSLTTEERARIMDIVNKNCTLLTDLINSILDISRIESDRAKYEIDNIDMVEMCQAMLSSVKMANNDLPIEFKFECEQKRLMFNTDRQRIQQVLLNLLGNAVKFTQQGTVILSLKSQANGSITVSVTDTGKGIPPDRAEDVFNRFVKLNEYSNGTGLGLSLCRLIVEKFHGKIWVDTMYTTGARFIFTLPPIEKDEIL